jgi:hypothetical protein
VEAVEARIKLAESVSVVAVTLKAELERFELYRFGTKGNIKRDERGLRAVYSDVVSVLQATPHILADVPWDTTPPKLIEALQRLKLIHMSMETTLRQATQRSFFDQFGWRSATEQRETETIALLQHTNELLFDSTLRRQTGFFLEGISTTTPAVSMFGPEFTRVVNTDDGLKGFVRSPHPIVALLQFVADTELHVLKLRGFAGKHAVLTFIELPLLLAKLKDQQAGWVGGVPVEWQFPTTITGQRTARSVVADLLAGALNMAADAKKLMGWKFRQTDGTGVFKAVTELDRRISTVMPPALEVPLRGMEIGWRSAVGIITAVDPMKDLGKSCPAVSHDLQVS